MPFRSSRISSSTEAPSDRVIAAGGYISVRTGSAPDAHAIPVPKDDADAAFDAAACIGCGACVAACKNASAMLFVSAKASHLNHLPQGEVEKDQRVLNMVRQMDAEGFGNCTNQFECESRFAPRRSAPSTSQNSTATTSLASFPRGHGTLISGFSFSTGLSGRFRGPVFFLDPCPIDPSPLLHKRVAIVLWKDLTTHG